VTRCLEIISEASRRLPDDLKARHPLIAWKQVAGAGKVYRHDYEDVATRYVLDTVHAPLSTLKPANDVIERDQRNSRRNRERVALPHPSPGDASRGPRLDRSGATRPSRSSRILYI